MTLVISKKQFDAVIKHCQDDFPIEACGILLGKRVSDERIVEEIRVTKNILHSPSSYQVDPEEQYRAFVESEQRGLEVLGFYHSHPYWEARPSNVDKDQAYYDDVVYLIYSLPQKALKSFVYHEKKFTEEKLRIVDA